jgi:hypothetical protein
MLLPAAVPQEGQPDGLGIVGQVDEAVGNNYRTGDNYTVRGRDYSIPMTESRRLYSSPSAPLAAPRILGPWHGLQDGFEEVGMDVRLVVESDAAVASEAGKKLQ